MTRTEWVDRVYREAVESVRNAGRGDRNAALFQASARLSAYIADGAVDGNAAVRDLTEAARVAGLTAGEVSATIRSGIHRDPANKAWYPTDNGGSFIRGPTIVPWRGRSVVAGAGDVSPVVDVLRRVGTATPSSPVVHPLRAVTYPSRKVTQGALQPWTWEDVAAMLAEPETWPGSKDLLPLWSAAEIEDDDRARRPDGIDSHTGIERLRPPVLHRVHALVLDYDDDPTWSIEQVATWWAGVSWLAHTSASHMVAKADGRVLPRGRVIVPLSRAVTEDEHAALAAWVQAGAHGVPGSKELKNPRRAYFVPSQAPGGYHSGHSLCGRSLDVDAVLRAAREAVQAVEGGRRLAHETTPDGRPYVVRLPGAGGWLIATARGGFAPVDDAILATELRRHWPGLELEAGEGDDRKAMGPRAIYERYGTRARGVVYTYCGTSRVTYHDDHDVEVMLRVCDSQAPPPVRHGDVLEWLHVLCGDRVDTVLDWLATCTDLSAPTAALVMIGAGSSGKSMLATGLAAYFGAETADYDDVFKERFNDALLRSPVVWLDEHTQVKAKSAGFRRLTANRTHAIEAKGRPSTTLHGCPRLVVTSNDPDPLGLSREALSLASERAIGVRVISVDTSDDAVAWLEERGGTAYTAEWVRRHDGAPGKIPELLAWLRVHRSVKVGPRFLVHGSASEWAAKIGTREGLPSTVLDAIARWLDDGHVRRDLIGRGIQPVIADSALEGRVLVSNRGLRDAWEALIGDRPPTHRQVADALRRLSGEEDCSKQVTLSDGRRSPRGALVALALLADRREEG